MLPKNVKVFPLQPGGKQPATAHGHLNAKTWGGKDYPTSNYGISLDGRFLVVDFDTSHPERDDIEARLPVTWQQKTTRTDADGRHWLYTVPEGFVGSGQVVIKGSDGGKIADVKARGYIVGPGSHIGSGVYTVVNHMEPVPAPQWLLDLSKENAVTPSLAEGGGIDGIPNQQHDRFLLEVASWLRGQRGFSEEAIAKFLRKGPLNVLQDVDDSRPYLEKDILRIAHSAGRYEALNAYEDYSLSPEEWKSALDIETNLKIMEWLLYGFVPKNELSLIYGSGGIGKSTLASWLSALALQKGWSVGFAGVEEPFERFAVRTKLTDPSLPLESFGSLINIGNLWKFPRDADKLREGLTKFPLDMLYFDSIYTHFDTVEGHEGIRARTCLSPLAAIAQEMGVTVIGTFHENKAGSLMGSVEMENVCRSLLHATRPKGRSFHLSVQKTNFIEPEYDLQFNGELREAVSLQGNPWLEKNENDEIVPIRLFVMKDYIKTNEKNSEELIYDLDELEDDNERKAAEIYENEPWIRGHELAERLHIGVRMAQMYLKKLKG